MPKDATAWSACGASQATYDDNFARLALAKAKYDPMNLFRVNQKIEPAVAWPVGNELPSV